MQRLVLAAAVLFAAAPALAVPSLRQIDDFEMRIGDRGAWVPVAMWNVPAANDEVWLRATVDVPAGLRRPGQPLGVYFAALASHQLWWDGTLLGQGGVVGRSAAEERPGPVEAHYQVPDRLASPGPHRLLLRTSAFHRHFAPRFGYWAIRVGDYEAIVLMRRTQAWLASIALSGLVLTALFALAMFLLLRERASLLLGLLAVSAAGALVAEAWRPIFGYTYDHHVIRLALILGLAWLTGFQLLALVIVRFPRPGGRWLLAAAALAAAAASLLMTGWDGKALVVYLICFAAALGWAALAAWWRAPGSRLACLGLATAVAGLVLEPLPFLDYGLYFALDFLFICLLWSHALEARRQREAKASAELKSARLEAEMLKRHIQPHFLMNTLTALAQWVEEDPPTAVRMIDSVADELGLLATLSDRKLIRTEDELRLCRNHLATMSLRKDVRYELEVDGVRGDEPMPPAVLHTLVENAVTHGASAPRVTLRLSARGEGHRVRYVLESPAPEGDDEDQVRAGTGTRYVEARLREAWGDDWSFRQGRAGGTWRAELVVPAGSIA